jgi:hypothetical protein
MKNILKDKFNSINQSKIDSIDLAVLNRLLILTDSLTTVDKEKIEKAILILDKIISKNPLALKNSKQNSTKMKRYIEIIFDDSGSMNEYVNGEQKHLIAKRIIKEQIIPKIDFKNSEVYLRTLSRDCKTGFSKKIILDHTIQHINDEIDNIICTKSTPLYYTIKDSIEACKNSGFSESHIFILTDGDDTCSTSPEQILGNDFLKIKQQLNLNTILVQFAIESDITKNNLTALGQKIAATNVVIDTKDLKNKIVLDQKITKSFIKSGLNSNIPFPHCQVEMKNDIYMAELIEYDFFLVKLLYQEKFLSWKPTLKKKLTSEQTTELEFLYNLRFKNNLPEAQVRLMLSALQKPYQYSFDCIYWDFKERVWKYFDDIPKLNLLDNPDALLADNFDHLNLEYKEKETELFDKRTPYEVILLPLNDKYNDRFKLVKFEFDGSGSTIILQKGDIVEFKK